MLWFGGGVEAGDGGCQRAGGCQGAFAWEQTAAGAGG